MLNNENLQRLENLPHLGMVKNKNITILSKSNNFHDTVKFFARIDIDNVICDISFKASFNRSSKRNVTCTPPRLSI